MNKPRKVQELLKFDRQICSAYRLKHAPIAGIDEVGRGPLAGPLLACAVILKKAFFSVPIDDSKKLTPLARERAYRQILPHAHVGLGIVSPQEIDRLGIQAAWSIAMLRAFKRLPVQPALLLIDGPRSFTGCTVPAVPIIRGDAKSLVIACASIVAKVTRDRWMGKLDLLFPEYGFLSHKGYGTAAHMKILRQIGPSEFHRFSFRPVRFERAGCAE